MPLDVRDASTFTQKTCKLSSGHTYHYVDERNAATYRGTCLLLHGFPDSWYGWRYQIKAFSQAGYRVLAPTQLGYAPTSQPDDLSAYTSRALSADTAELLDQAGASEKVYLFGHDWGGWLAWLFARYHTDRVKCIAVVCTPYLGPAQPTDKWVSDEALIKKLPNFGYQITFASEEGEDLLTKNLDGFLIPSFAQVVRPDLDQIRGQRTQPWTYPGEFLKRLRLLEARRQQGQPLWRPSRQEDPELHFYLDYFEKSGIHHPLSYYRTRKLRFEDEQKSGLPTKFPASIPAYYLTGDKDEALPINMSDGVERFFAPGKYRRDIVPDAHHWLLQDASTRDEVTRRLLEWLNNNNGTAQPKL